MKTFKQGQIVLFKDKKSFIGWAIRAVTESNWNHVGQIVDDDGNMVEALFGGVTFTNISNYTNKNRFDIKILEIDDKAFDSAELHQEAVVKSCERLVAIVGQKYDLKAIAWLLIMYTQRGFLKKVRLHEFFKGHNFFESRFNFFCSEAICMGWRGLAKQGVRLFSLKPCTTTTPKDIAKSEWVKSILGPKIS